MLNHIKQTTKNAMRDNGETIPPVAWIGGAIFLAAVFGLVPLIGWLQGAI